MKNNNNQLKLNDTRPLILIVDDEPGNIALLVAALGDIYRIMIATNGKKALEIVNQSPNKPDLILLDVMMPEMDGYHVCKVIKNNPDTANIAIIFITAKTGHLNEINGLELGAIDYISKPFHIKAVISRVNNQIARKIQMDRLIENEQHMLQLAASNSGSMFSLERNPDGLIHFPFINSNALNLYELHPKDIQHSPQALIDAIFKDDLTNLFASFNRSWKNQTHWRCEYRIHTAKSRLKWLRIDASPQPLGNGCVRWNGAITDISKRKRAEEWLWLANREMKVDVDELTQQSIPIAPNKSAPVKLKIDFEQRCLCIGHQQVFLRPADLAFYAWLASRTIAKLGPITCPPDGVPVMEYAVDFLNQYRSVVGELGGDERMTSALKYGMDKGYFLSRKSKVNKAIHEVLSGYSALHYEIKCFGKRPRSVYAVDIDPDQIILCAPLNPNRIQAENDKPTLDSNNLKPNMPYRV